MSDCSLLYGRSLLKEEVDVRLIREKEDLIRIKPAFTTVEGKKVCSRCSAVPDLSRAYPCTCGGNCLYCRECINLGKVRECGRFYSITEPNRFDRHARPYLKWRGTLSEQQKEASDAITESVRNNKELLVWAVAGAGKTEMLFKALADALEAGKRVCITSPRIDVCLELAPRIQESFPTVPMAVLYGGAEESYVYTQLVIATTHQLYRFEEAFDVLIIDEVDAFPFHMNAALLFAAEKARKKRSSRICLTATPDQSMQKRVRKGKLEAVILPARYHGHALPVPKAVFHGE
ncbi:MAG: DEAD/DEAH box helicase family protein [Alkalibacterium sp.]|nr:DEAD/DEAH box helicase family protein [Alkalibacterium sp.]